MTDTLLLAAAAPATLTDAVGTPNLTELVNLFLSRRSRETRLAYGNDLRALAKFMAVRWPAHAVGIILRGGAGEANALLLRWRYAMQEAGLSPMTRNRRMATVRSMTKLARILGLIAWEAEIEGEPVETYRHTTRLTEADYRKLLAVADIRETALLRLLHDLALRRAEVQALNAEQVDVVKGLLTYVGKGRTQPAQFTLPRPTLEALEAYLNLRGHFNGPLFLSGHTGFQGVRITVYGIRYLVDCVAKRAGISHVNPHALRHCAITTVLDRNGGDVRAAAQFSRHKNIQTVMLYDRNRRDLQGEMAKLAAAEGDKEGLCQATL